MAGLPVWGQMGERHAAVARASGPSSGSTPVRSFVAASAQLPSSATLPPALTGARPAQPAPPGLATMLSASESEAPEPKTQEIGPADGRGVRGEGDVA